MQMPRILMISTHGYVAANPSLGRPDTGGQVVYLLELSKALAGFGYIVDILTRGFDNRPAIEPVAESVRIIRVNYGGPHFRPKEVLSQFVPELIAEYFKQSEFSQDQYDLIISHYWDSGVAGTALARQLGVRHIHIPHSMGVLKRQNQAWGSTGETDSDWLNLRIRHERAIYHQADFVVTTTNEQTVCVCESDEYNVPDVSVVQIPAGINKSIFHPITDALRDELREDLGWDSPTVFCAGRFDVSKGYDLAVRAFPAVLQRVPTARLVLAICNERPSGKEQILIKELKSLAQHLRISDNVELMSCLDQKRLADHYRAADLFVLPSRNEPFGMTAIEAMACGTPTILTTRGGLWEEMTWGRDCIYCDPLDSDALSQAICSPLLQPRIRQQLAVGGALTVHSRYSWQKIAHQLLTTAIDRKVFVEQSSHLMSLR